MKITQDTFVTLRIQTFGSDGAVLDDAMQPVRYLHGGYGGVFPKLEAALDGKEAGDCLQVTLAPADTFGEWNPALSYVAPLSDFAQPPRLGDMLEGNLGGVSLRCRVIAQDERTVTLDANHPQSGMTVTFVVSVQDVHAATPEEVSAEISALSDAKAEARAMGRVLAQAKALGEIRMEEAAEAEAEAAGLVETIHVAQLGTSFRFVFHSETHKSCWLAPMFLLPGIAGWFGSRGQMVGCGVVVALWLGWCFFAPAVIGKAIKCWGDRFLFFDFSRNPDPSPLERRLIAAGQIVSVLVFLACAISALFHMKHLSDLWEVLGALLAIVIVLGVVVGILAPFLVIVLTAFRVRPVTDKGVSN